MTAWLVEHRNGRAWLGQCNGRGRWTTANQAIRFSRKEDAEAVIELLGADAIATEHSWM